MTDYTALEYAAFKSLLTDMSDSYSVRRTHDINAGNYVFGAIHTGVVTFCTEVLNFLKDFPDAAMSDMGEVLDILTLENLAAIRMVRGWQFRDKSDADDTYISLMVGTTGEHLLMGYEQVKRCPDIEDARITTINTVTGLFIGRFLTATYFKNTVSGASSVSFDEWRDNIETNGLTVRLYDRTFTIDREAKVLGVTA